MFSQANCTWNLLGVQETDHLKQLARSQFISRGVAQKNLKEKVDSSSGEILDFGSKTNFALMTGANSILAVMPSHCRPSAYSLPLKCTVESGVFAMQSPSGTCQVG